MQTYGYLHFQPDGAGITDRSNIICQCRLFQGGISSLLCTFRYPLPQRSVMSDAIQYKSLSPVSVKERDHIQSHRSERISPLTFARPSKLNRSTADIILLIATDLLIIFAWTGMFIYAILLWYARNRFVDKISFSVLNLIQAVTT